VHHDLLNVFTGLSGLLPIHPRTFIQAWRNRRAASEATNKDENVESTSTN
jgi:small subunit ribosomal protein S16